MVPVTAVSLLPRVSVVSVVTPVGLVVRVIRHARGHASMSAMPRRAKVIRLPTRKPPAAADADYLDDGQEGP